MLHDHGRRGRRLEARIEQARRVFGARAERLRRRCAEDRATGCVDAGRLDHHLPLGDALERPGEERIEVVRHAFEVPAGRRVLEEEARGVRVEVPRPEHAHHARERGLERGEETEPVLAVVDREPVRRRRPRTIDHVEHGFGRVHVRRGAQRAGAAVERRAQHGAEAGL